jgi:hypothetical protein
MRPLPHFKKSSDHYFHRHPLQNLFLLLVFFLLAVLAVLILPVPAK